MRRHAMSRRIGYWLTCVLAVPLWCGEAEAEAVTLNCWDDFHVQSNTVNGGPFRDSRMESCPLGTNYVRVVEGQTEGYCEVTLDGLTPLECFDLVFEYLNDGEDGGRIDVIANERIVGSVQGSGHHDLERCERVTFRNLPLYSTSLTIRLAFQELSPTQFRHNGAVRLTLRQSAMQPVDLQVTGEPVPGGVLSFNLHADPSAEGLLGYYLAGARSASGGTVLSDGRIFPLDDPIRVARGTFDVLGRATAAFEIPRGRNLVGRTYYFAYVTYLPPGDESGMVGRVSPVVAVTVVSR
jgi:hypothetical protein